MRGTEKALSIPRRRLIYIMKLSRQEQDTIIIFKAGKETAAIYTRDKSVIRKLDALVDEFLKVYRCISITDNDRKYELSKFAIMRSITEACRNAARNSGCEGTTGHERSSSIWLCSCEQ